MISANLLVVILVAMIAGGFTGLALDGAVSEMVLAVAAGFIGVLASAIVRNMILVRWHGLCPGDAALPGWIVAFSILASLAGSLAAHEIVLSVAPIGSGLLGMLAGLFSAMLMVMLMLTHYLNSGRPGDLLR